tara:strand:- start:2192 stop:2635 length:444 start_codon:yes stop_codon:yes gene_type:complete
MYKATYKGRYRVINPSKYRGDSQDVTYRSSWELKFMKWCDTNPSVLEWGSETIIIPYTSPVDNRVHRYFVDFYIKVQDRNGKINRYLVEIKPAKFTKPPEIPARKTRRFVQEVFQYGTNQAKWKAANEYCVERSMQFLVLTEVDLGI